MDETRDDPLEQDDPAGQDDPIEQDDPLDEDEDEDFGQPPGPPAPEPEAPRRPEQANGSLLRATPGLARITASAWWRANRAAAHATARAGRRVLRAATSDESPSDLFQAAGAYAREYARRTLGLVGDAGDREEEEAEPSLRDQGAELLRRSADVDYDEAMHPAYAGILTQLAPDETRILRLLSEQGPQPAVDVRTSRPLGIGSELLAPGLNMIAAEAGCRYVDRVHSYLNNLFRLGLVWFSREPVRDPLRYQVLEAQPEVAEAMRQAKRVKTVRRSVHLTPFGADFCEYCLPLDAEDDAEGSSRERDEGAAGDSLTNA